jgi:hypothetical protein
MEMKIEKLGTQPCPAGKAGSVLLISPRPLAVKRNFTAVAFEKFKPFKWFKSLPGCETRGRAFSNTLLVTESGLKEGGKGIVNLLRSESNLEPSRMEDGKMEDRVWQTKAPREREENLTAQNLARQSRNRNSEYLAQRRKGRKEI